MIKFLIVDLVLLLLTTYISAAIDRDGGVIDTPDKNNKGGYKYKYIYQF